MGMAQNFKPLILAHVPDDLGSVVGTYCCRTAIGIEKESYEFVGQFLDA